MGYLKKTLTAFFNRIILSRKKLIGREGLESYDSLLDIKREEIRLSLKNSNIPSTYQQEFLQSFLIEKGGVFSIPNARIYGRIGLIKLGSKLLIENHLNKYYYLNKSGDTKYLLKFWENPRVNSGTHLILSASVSDNYFMWMMYFVPLIQLVVSADIQPKHVTVWLRNKAPAFQYESLAHFGFAAIKELDGSALEFERLIIPTFRYLDVEKSAIGHYNVLSRNAILWMNKTYDQEVLRDRIVIISRSKTNRRRLVNENEIHQILGGDIVHLEEMTFDEQVRLFNQAKVVISPHGAGLTNLIFGKNIKVFEFYPDTRTLNNPKNLQICDYLDHTYHLFIQPSINEKQDMNVDLETIKYIQRHV
ncbi:MAG: glycosyltransferase family 61 protein [Marinoscillum sp.]